MRENHFCKAFAVMAVVSIWSNPVRSATVDVDGVAIKTLSAAISQAQAADDGPHVINIKTDSLPTPDGEILISEPMTINGDADGNGEKCDILAGVAELQNSASTNDLLGKAYIKISAPGKVTINDLKIHPDTDGTKASDSELVDALRVFCPTAKRDAGEYELNRVWISGSDSNNKYIPLDTADDIYNQAGVKMWSRQSTMSNRGVIHCANQKAKGNRERGEYQLTLNDCHVGLGRGVGLNFTASSGKHTVNGGIYGHCGTEAIRVAGNTLALTGTPDSRLRLIRGANFTNSSLPVRLLSFTAKARLDKIEYVDLMPRPGSSEDLNTLVPAALGADKRELRLITEESRMEVAVKGGKLPDVEPFGGWLTPEQAWSQAQAKKQNMLLFFYSPSVPMAEGLNKLLNSNAAAQAYLAKNAASRVNVKEPAGQSVAQKYGVFKVPTLLLIASDAKSYQKITPLEINSWNTIEKQLTKK